MMRGKEVFAGKLRGLSLEQQPAATSIRAPAKEKHGSALR